MNIWLIFFKSNNFIKTTKKELIKLLENYNDDDLIGIQCNFDRGINLKSLEIEERNIPMPWIKPGTKKIVLIIKNIK